MRTNIMEKAGIWFYRIKGHLDWNLGSFRERVTVEWKSFSLWPPTVLTLPWNKGEYSTLTARSPTEYRCSAVLFIADGAESSHSGDALRVVWVFIPIKIYIRLLWYYSRFEPWKTFRSKRGREISTPTRFQKALHLQWFRST